MQARWFGIGTGAAAFVAFIGLIAVVADLRQEFLDLAQARETAHEALLGLWNDDAARARGKMSQLRLLFEGLSPSKERTESFREADAAVAAYASAPQPEGHDEARRALARFAARLDGEARTAASDLLRLTVSATLLGLCTAFLLVACALASRGAPVSSISAGQAQSGERLSALVEEVAQREQRYERFLAAMEATLIDIAPNGTVVQASPGASELFGRPHESLLGTPADALFMLSTEQGERLESWKSAGGSADAYLLRDAGGAGHLVTLDYIDQPGEGTSVLLRKTGPRHARLLAAREAEMVRETIFDDETLILMQTTPDARVRHASRGARRLLGLPQGAASLTDAWCWRTRFSELVSEAQTHAGLTGTRAIRPADGDPISVHWWLAPLRSGGFWVRGVPGPPSDEPVVAPADPSPQTRRTPEWVVAGGEDRPARVLVIDDEPAIGRSIARALREAEVVVAGGGAEGIERALASTEAWDLVLCDIGMPEVDGVEVYETLQKNSPELLERTVFMTGALHTDRGKSFVEQAKPTLLSKPFDVSALRAALRAHRR